MVRSKHAGIFKIFYMWIPLCVMLIFTLFPLYWTINTSLKYEGDINSFPVQYMPKTVTTGNFRTVWVNVNFSTFFRNSLFVTIISVLFVTFFSVFVGYALARYKFKGKGFFMFLLLATQFLPASLLIIPLFTIFRDLNLLDSPWSLIIINTTMQLSFNSILMRGFISGIPVELEEAARIDGCSKIGGIFKTVVPLLLPGLVATAAFSFVGVWNEFLFAFMFISSPSGYMLPVGLRSLVGENAINFGLLSAGSVIALVPVILMFVYLQKYLIAGLSAGSVKG